ncbi:MAG: sigma-54 interaction domain-containing protein [Lentihominibacter sp.]
MDYKKIIDELTEYIDEGVQVINHEGVTVVYNEKMAKLEKTKRFEVLGAGFREGYPDFPVGESTLLKAIEQNIPTLNKKQTYYNKYGKKISTINTTVPIIKNGQTIAAIEIAKDITTLTEMSNKLMDYQNEVGEKGKHNPGKIKKYTFDDIIGEDDNFRKLIKEAKAISNNPYSVLIYGETGTGKELFAQSIHFESSRNNKPFLAQNCAALPESLLEGILFGTSKGSFTGAVERSGLFEQASGGTLLLDEISAMPFELQSKLLRVLQENYIRRVGGNCDIPIDVRVIATSNEPLEKLIEQGKFREDLYYRLGTLSLKMIPLRERRNDILLLAETFIEKHSKIMGCDVLGLTDAAKEKLREHEYRGNVRELENVIIAAISIIGDEKIIDDVHINFPPQKIFDELADLYELNDMTLPEKLDDIEKNIIRRVMRECNYNVSKAAERMGVKRQTLQHKIKKYGAK